MATCKDCLHYDVCGGYTPTDLDRDVFNYFREGRGDEVPDVDERCNGFKGKSEWISVSERLPDKGQEVLAYRGDFNGDMMNTYTYLGSGNWEDDYGYRGSTEHEGITHWMPLPEPPDMKGGAE